MILKLDVKGFNKNFISDYSTLISRHIKYGVSSSMSAVEREVKKRAPVDSGDLKKSISVDSLNIGSREIAKNIMRFGVKYALFIEEGTKSRVIKARNARVLSDGSSFFGKRVKHPGTKATHFLKKSIKTKEKNVSSMLESELQKVLNNI